MEFNWGEKVFSVGISAVTAIIVFFLTKYVDAIWLSKLKEKRVDQKENLKTFQKYSNPILIAADEFYWRLKEIFDGRSSYLLQSTPKDNFHTYKRLSTLYRLCTMIGWIRAAERELSFFEVNSQQENREIIKSLSTFKGGLADGNHIEIFRVEFLAKLWGIDTTSLPNDSKEKLGITVEKHIKEYTDKKNVVKPLELDIAGQLELFRKILDEITSSVNTSNI